MRMSASTPSFTARALRRVAGKRLLAGAQVQAEAAPSGQPFGEAEHDDRRRMPAAGRERHRVGGAAEELDPLALASRGHLVGEDPTVRRSFSACRSMRTPAMVGGRDVEPSGAAPRLRHLADHACVEPAELVRPVHRLGSAGAHRVPRRRCRSRPGAACTKMSGRPSARAGARRLPAVQLASARRVATRPHPDPGGIERPLAGFGRGSARQRGSRARLRQVGAHAPR